MRRSRRRARPVTDDVPAFVRWVARRAILRAVQHGARLQWALYAGTAAGRWAAVRHHREALAFLLGAIPGPQGGPWRPSPRWRERREALLELAGGNPDTARRALEAAARPGLRLDARALWAARRATDAALDRRRAALRPRAHPAPAR